MKKQTFEQFLAEKGIPEITIQDQSPLSPSGHISNRAREAWGKREDERLTKWREATIEYQRLINSGEVIDPSGRYWPMAPGPSKEEQERIALNRRADELESLAERGMSPRKFRKEAARLREQAKPRLSR